MVWLIIVLIMISVCSYRVGYYGSKVNTLKEFEMVMGKIHDKAIGSDFSDDYQRGYAWGLIHAINMIQNSNVF